jgi:CheY-like chemotaxis protein
VPRAFVCEDDRTIRTLIEALLRREGMTTESAANGIEAASRLAGAMYDVVIIDLMLPGLSGYEVIRHMSEKNPALLSRIVVMTTAALAPFPEPVAAVMLKPFDINDFILIVRGILEQTG